MYQHLRKLKIEVYSKYIEDDNIEELEGLLKCDDDIPCTAISLAIKKNNVEMTKMMFDYSEKTPIMKYARYVGTIMYDAILSQNEDIVKLVKQHRVHDDMDSAKAALLLPFDKITEYLTKGYIKGNELVTQSILNNRLDIIEYLLPNITLTKDFLGTAIGASNLVIAQLLYDNGCPMSKYCYYSAIANNDTNMITWLSKRGCPYDKNVLTYASTLEVIKTFHELGFDMNFHVIVDHTSYDILAYLHKHRLSIYRNCTKCHLCDEERSERLEELEYAYELIDDDYQYSLQWLPQEMYDDVIMLL